MSLRDNHLNAALGGLDDWCQLALGAAMVERMRPNFELFCEVSGHGGREVFANILQLIWAAAAGTGPAVDFEKQQLKLDQILPDARQYDMYGVWPALDAVAAMTALLSCCQAFDRDDCDSVFDVSAATIAGFIEASEGVEADVSGHPLMVAEREFVDSLLTLAQSGAQQRQQRVAAIRDQARSVGQSNIGLSVE